MNSSVYRAADIIRTKINWTKETRNEPLRDRILYDAWEILSLFFVHYNKKISRFNRRLGMCYTFCSFWRIVSFHVFWIYLRSDIVVVASHVLRRIISRK